MSGNAKYDRDELNREAAALKEEELREWIGEERPLKQAAEDTGEANAGNDSEKETKQNSGLREVMSWIITFVIAIMVALVLKKYVIINATVPTGSMEHTIEPGDDLLGLRFVYKFSDPKRGDIIIFDCPDNKKEKYIKRVIGLPGETVTIEEGKIYIDGAKTPLVEDYLPDAWIFSTGPYEFQVPEGGYLVLGDNRNSSNDARFWENTYVMEDDIVGKAYVIYYPFSRVGSLYK